MKLYELGSSPVSTSNVLTIFLGCLYRSRKRLVVQWDTILQINQLYSVYRLRRERIMNNYFLIFCLRNNYIWWMHSLRKYSGDISFWQGQAGSPLPTKSWKGNWQLILTPIFSERLFNWKFPFYLCFFCLNSLKSGQQSSVARLFPRFLDLKTMKVAFICWLAIYSCRG